uniref:Uncharacterized protein n=1 Tax=Periophthalmus magnuspinnatus TaxID=409849 RepID=A0A3B4B4W6_9GOBI
SGRHHPAHHWVTLLLCWDLTYLCTCLPLTVYNCTLNEFKCANGHQCINSYYRCDGVFDCNDLLIVIHQILKKRLNHMFDSLYLYCSQLQDLQGCATTRVNFSASRMAAVCHRLGSVMGTQTVKMAVMSIMPAPLAPAPPQCSAVITATVYCPAGFAMGTMIAET